MRIRYFLATLILTLSINHYSQAQFLKKLKNKVENAAERALTKKAEQKTEEVVENAFDSIADSEKKDRKTDNTKKTRGKAGSNENAASVNGDIKRSFYTYDVLVTSDENGAKGSTMSFDADVLAMKMDAHSKNKTSYTDSEAYTYIFNDNKGRWEKTGLMKNDAMSFMMPMMSISMIKLPVEPMMDAVENFKKQGVALNTFMIVEWAFVYKPEHFKNADYTETVEKCGNKQDCLRFLFNDAQYLGSYVQFDPSNRISIVHMEVDTPEGHKSGSTIFNYETPISLVLPDAEEVKMPLQDLWGKGLDATPLGNGNNSSSTDRPTFGSSQSGGNVDRPSNNEGPNSNTPTNTYNTSPKSGRLALMFLKHYACCSDQKLIEQLNSNLNYQFFCDISLGYERITILRS